MALPQLPAHAQHQLGQGVNKENPLTRVYAKRAANCLAALFVYALSPMEINIPLLAHGLLRIGGFPLQWRGALSGYHLRSVSVRSSLALGFQRPLTRWGEFLGPLTPFAYFSNHRLPPSFLCLLVPNLIGVCQFVPLPVFVY